MDKHFGQEKKISFYFLISKTTTELRLTEQTQKCRKNLNVSFNLKLSRKLKLDYQSHRF